MSDVEIKGRISVDTGNTQKSVNEMLDSIKATKKALADAKVGSAEYKKVQEDLSKQTKELNTTLDKSGGSFSKLKETLGGTIPGFQGATQGASGLGKQLWLLVANPIVAVLALIVGGLMLLYKAFASTNDGADKLEQIMSGIGATVEVLRDRVLKVGEAIGKFFSGDFKGALEVGKQAVKGIGQEIADEFAAASDATRILQELDDAMRSLSVGRAELNRDLAKAKEIMADADASFSDRSKALREVRAKEGEQNKKELEHAKAEFEAIQKQNRLSKNVSDEDLDREAAAQVKMIELQTSSANQLRSLNRMERTLARDAQQKKDAEDKERAEAQKKKDAAYIQGVKDKSNAEKEEAQNLQDTVSDIAAIDLANKKTADAEKDKLAQREIDRGSFAAQGRVYDYEAEKEIDQQKLSNKRALSNAIFNIANTLADELGKQTAAGKVIAIAGALIDTYSAIAATLKNAAKTPMGGIPGYAIAQAIATGIFGLATVKKIVSVKVPSGSASSISVPGSMSSATSVSAPIQPTSTNTRLDSTSIQGVGNAASGGVSRAFVLESDIKNNRERSEMINRAARLG